MVDFVGQTLNEGDYVVIVSPYTRNHAIGKIKKITNKQATVWYIPGYMVYGNDHYTVEDKEAIVNLLLSDNPDASISCSIPNCIFGLYTTSRDTETIIRIDKGQVMTFLERII